MLNLDTHILLHALAGTLTKHESGVWPGTAGEFRLSCCGKSPSWTRAHGSRWDWIIRMVGPGAHRRLAVDGEVCLRTPPWISPATRPTS